MKKQPVRIFNSASRLLTKSQTVPRKLNKLKKLAFFPPPKQMPTDAGLWAFAPLPYYSRKNQFYNMLRESVARKGIPVIAASNLSQLRFWRWRQKYGQLQRLVIQLHQLDPWYHNSSAGERAAAFQWGAFYMELRFRQLLGDRIVWTVHNSLPHDLRYPQLDRDVHIQMGEMADCVVTLSRTSKDLLIAEGVTKEKISVVPHGNYIGLYGPISEKKVARRKLGLLVNPDRKLLVHFGQIKEYKGIESLVNIAAKNRKASFELIILGQGDSMTIRRVHSVAQAKSHIRFIHRFISDRELGLWLSAADGIVLPFKRVLHSGSVILSMSYARPVITSRLGALSELIEDGRDGLLFEPQESEKGLELALERFCSLSDSEIEEIGEIAYRKAKSLDWDEIGSVYKSLFEKLALKG